MTDLAIVIVNYNAGDALQRTLTAVDRARGASNWAVVIVDNASTDGSVEAVEARPHRTIIRQQRNEGFGAACNRGAAHVTAPWTLFLNPDCTLTAGVVEHLIAEAAQHPRCAAIGPCILDPDGSVQGSARFDPTVLAGFAGRASWLTRLVPGSQRIFRQVVWPDRLPPGQRSIEVDWLSGACLLMRRTPFDQVGGFDREYFLYWEDADLCRRLRQAGHTIRYAPRVAVRHEVGRSSRTARRASVTAFHQSAYRYYSRWNAPSRWDPRRLLARMMLGMRRRAALARVPD